MQIKNSKLYDVLKWLARYCLPALAVFWIALSEIYNLPLRTEIPATISAVVILLNTLLGISNENYNRDNKDE